MDYNEFINTKTSSKKASGFKVPSNWLNDSLFDYQKEIVDRSLYNGKYALFMDTGLGKSICQMNFADAALRKTNKPVLQIAPLAVVYQLEKEASKFGYELNRITDNSNIKKAINITNYDSLKKIDTSKFESVVLDESSILKNFTGQIKQDIISGFKHSIYKLACTATPSPNDMLELGNHSDFLDIMPSHEMIMRYFLNDTMNAGGYRLKGHAEKEFWSWIASWAECITSPADLGYDGSSHILPKLNEIYHEISHDDCNYDCEDALFSFNESNATTLSKNKKETLEKRASKVLEILTDEQFLIWVDTNEESEYLSKLIPNSIEVKGSDKDTVKAERLNGFADGTVKYLITKSSIAGMGMNFQNANNMIFFGLNYSYEKYYQAVRRMYRFGQEKGVNVHIIVADNEINILKIIHQKGHQHDTMKTEMQKAILNAKKATDIKKQIDSKIQIPDFLKGI